MKLRSLILLIAIACLATPAFAGSYVSGGTFVVKSDDFGTIVDNGGVICTDAVGNGIGGGCIPFPTSTGREGKSFVHVFDQRAGRNVAFQVCIDNNGDGVCGGPQLEGICRDQIFFSHADGGVFHNPLGPLPTSFRAGCAGNGGYPGYVVLLCTGTHDDQELGPHQHALTTGSIGLAGFGSGYGDFCGGGSGGNETGETGDNPAIAKAYVVV